MGIHIHLLISYVYLLYIRNTISYYLVIVLHISFVCDLIYEELFQFTFSSFNLI